MTILRKIFNIAKTIYRVAGLPVALVALALVLITGAIGDPVYQGSGFAAGSVPVIGADGVTINSDDTATSLKAPTGRGANYTIFGSDITNGQGDYHCDGTNDQAESNTVLALIRPASTLNPPALNYTVAWVGTFYLDDSINATDLVGVNFDFRAAKFVLQTTGKPGIDFTGSRYYNIWGGFFTTSANHALDPNLCWVFARHADGYSIDQTAFYGTKIFGTFTSAVFYCFGLEETAWFGVTAFNYHATGHVFYWTATNYLAFSSAFTTTYAASASSTLGNFWGCKFYQGTGSGVAVYIRQAVSSLHFEGGMLCSVGNAGVQIEIASTNMDTISFNGVRITDYKPIYGFKITASGSGQVNGLRITNCVIDSRTKDIYCLNVTAARWYIDKSNKYVSSKGFDFSSNIQTDSYIYGPSFLSQNSGTITMGGGTATDGTASIVGSPVTLVPGANTITLAADATSQTITVNLPTGNAGTAVSGTATVTGSPQTLNAGNNTVTITGTAGQTVTINTADTQVTVAHGCTGMYQIVAGDKYIKRVNITATADPGAANAFWVSNKGETTFIINAKVPITSVTTFDWYAYEFEDK